MKFRIRTHLALTVLVCIAPMVPRAHALPGVFTVPVDVDVHPKLDQTITSRTYAIKNLPGGEGSIGTSIPAVNCVDGNGSELTFVGETGYVAFFGTSAGPDSILVGTGNMDGEIRLIGTATVLQTSGATTLYDAGELLMDVQAATYVRAGTVLDTQGTATASFYHGSFVAIFSCPISFESLVTWTSVADTVGVGDENPGTAAMRFA